ncbi:MAG: BamA/TamA family outer membrane protein [Lentisphaerae bacterium]|nr:BamA/TamA family outer membrane protein [Lentisphaerota bacterium]
MVNIRYIDIRGNTRTKDKVIRRELLVYPGELYDMVRVRRSERILQNLGYFSKVASYPRETREPFSDDLVYEVEESRTGQFMVGAGYSSVDEVIGFAELSQGNFDLLGWPHFIGGGQKLRLRAQVGTAMQDYLISFVEPWFLDRKLSLGLDLYNTTRSNLSDYYNEERLGAAVTLGKPLRGYFHRANLRYSLEEITIYNISDDAVQRIKNEAGARTVSSLKLTFIHDTRDNMFVPTSGVRNTLAARVSGGPLGFDTDMYGLEADYSVYFPLWFGHVFNLRGWAAVVQEYGDDDDVRLFDRLFLGGARTLRGFKYRYVSPYEEGEPIGGKTAALAAAEYTVPLTRQVLRLAFFYELGNVWLDAYEMNEEYNSDVGIGLRLNIPGFPIRLDYAWPLEVSGDVARTSARFNFWLGYGF